MSEKEYLTAISAFGYFGPARINLLLSVFKTSEKIWRAPSKKLLEIGIPQGKVLEFLNFREKFDIPVYFEKLKKLGIKVITIWDKNYPTNLKKINDMPPVIYCKGEINQGDENAVAIVGTRMMTSYGKEVATKLAGELAGYGITIISGLALGIDGQAQSAAVNAGGRTIAVLASGLDTVSPSSNRLLASKIIKGNGAIISEYPLGHAPFKSDFAVRNRLISGLAKAVLVIEGRMKSGTFYTVNAANDQGKTVFAVPGPITSPGSEGPNYLIQNGAKLTTSARDILEELSIETRVDKVKMEMVLPGGKPELDILNVLEVEALQLDEVVRILGLTTAEVSARLTIMEIKGLVKKIDGAYRKI